MSKFVNERQRTGESLMNKERAKEISKKYILDLAKTVLRRRSVLFSCFGHSETGFLNYWPKV